MSKVLWGPTVEEPPIQVPGTFESVPQGYSRLKQYETDFGYGQRLGSVFRKNAHHCSWEVPHAVRDFADNFKFGKPSVKPVSKEEMEEAVDATPAPEPPVEPPARAEPPARHGASPNPGPRALVKSPGTPTDPQAHQRLLAGDWRLPKLVVARLTQVALHGRRLQSRRVLQLLEQVLRPGLSRLVELCLDLRVRKRRFLAHRQHRNPLGGRYPRV